jgi:hypothetical protein
MVDYNKNYNFSALYVCGLILVYNIWNSDYIHFTFNKLYMLNYTSITIIIINIFGLYLLLKNISFEVNIKLSYLTALNA